MSEEYDWDDLEGEIYIPTEEEADFVKRLTADRNLTPCQACNAEQDEDDRPGELEDCRHYPCCAYSMATRGENA
jgi:hypothetical protein